MLELLAAVALAAAAPVPDRTCDQRAEPPVERYERRAGDVRLGRVVFLGLHRRSASTALRDVPGADPGMKVPVLVRAGPPVVARLVRRGRTIARLEYVQHAPGDTPARRIAGGRGQRAVRFHACDPATPSFSVPGATVGAWTAFPGGFAVARRGCAVLRVGEHRRRIALGVPVSRCRPARATTARGPRAGGAAAAPRASGA